MVAFNPHISHNYGMDMCVSISRFTQELADYIGRDYLIAHAIVIGSDTRFDQLNFDILDQVIVEQMIQQMFDIDEFVCDDWPDTVGQLLRMVAADHG